MDKAISQLIVSHFFTELNHLACALVAQNRREAKKALFFRHAAVDNMKICSATKAACVNLNKHFIISRLRDRHVIHHLHLAGAHDGNRFHILLHNFCTLLALNYRMAE